MRHKMITLCPTTYEIAQGMDNFSAWVRTKLTELDPNKVTEDPIFHKYKCPICKMTVESEQRYARHCGFCNYPMKYIHQEELD